MIWDRFDDAHDGLLDDIADEEQKIKQLEAKLKARGIAFDLFAKPESRNEPGPQGWYEDTLRQKFSLIAHRKYLQGLLADNTD